MKYKKQIIDPEIDRNHYALIIAILLAYVFAFTAFGVIVYLVAEIIDKLLK